VQFDERLRLFVARGAPRRHELHERHGSRLGQDDGVPVTVLHPERLGGGGSRQSPEHEEQRKGAVHPGCLGETARIGRIRLTP